MKNYRVESIRGYSIDHFQELLTESTSELPSKFKIRETALGGWTNVNVLLETRNTPLVLKIPAIIEEYESNPYTYVVHISSQISKHGLCAKPITIGRLADSRETPFAIFEYIEGDTISSANYLSVENEIARVLRVFSELKPDGINCFSNAVEYHQRLLKELEVFNARMKPKDTSLRRTLDTLLDAFRTFTSHIIGSTSWPQLLMHGDLRLDNIVLTNDGPVLLDLESCALGEPILDLLYMKMESEDTLSLSNLSDVPKSKIQILSVLALLPVISWTLKRLIYLDHNMVETSLSSGSIRDRMNQYLSVKMKELTICLSSLSH